MMGGTAPATIERASVLTVAESLVGLVTIQNKQPGSKYIFDDADSLRVDIVNPK
jgi:trimethylamine:corrinoid methyltransferase-like protein